MNTKKRFPVLLNVDISQTENSVEIEADITGFKTQNINVSTWQNSLVIEMTREHERGDSYYMGELEPESYRRVVPLDFPVDAGTFQTQYSLGAMRIVVAKPDIAAMPERRLRAIA